MLEAWHVRFNVVTPRPLYAMKFGPSIIAELRSRFRLVLADEFQDTDTVKENLPFAFIERTQVSPHFVVVGDKKQSIYRFRDELSAYLEALSTPIRMAVGVFI